MMVNKTNELNFTNEKIKVSSKSFFFFPGFKLQF